MIFYFSGTGNSRWVARELARLLHEDAVDVTDAAAAAAARDLADGGVVGLVFPIYAWGAAEPMAAFAERLEVPAGAFTFGVCTYGSEAGRAMDRLGRTLRLDSAYGIAMPNNYVIGSELEPPEQVRAKLAAAAGEVERIAGEVARRAAVTRVHEGSAAALKSSLVNWGFNRFARSTKPFTATDACVGCGRCAAGCPAAAIEMADGRPRWRAGSCYLCLRCINECPVRAIEYGDATRSRSRYAAERYIGPGDGAGEHRP